MLARNLRKGQLFLIALLFIIVIGAAVIVFILVRPDIFGMILMGLGALVVFMFMFMISSRGKIGLKALAVPIIIALSLTLPIAVTVTTAATTVRLQADMGHALLISNHVVTLYKAGSGPHFTAVSFVLGADDVRRLLSYGVDTYYVIIHATAIDPYGQQPPPVSVALATPYTTISSVIYLTDFQRISTPGNYEFPIPRTYLEQIKDSGGRVIIRLYRLWNTVNGPDHRYGVTFDRVWIAPATVGSNSNDVSEQHSISHGVIKWLAIGGFVIAVAALAIVLGTHRRG